MDNPGRADSSETSGTRRPAPSRRRRLLVVLGLILGSTALGLLVLEAAVRLRRGTLTDFNSVHNWPLELLTSGYFDHDPRLGWVLRPNEARHGETSIRIDANGCRMSGPEMPADTRKPILAVGDSFTFGTDVSDEDAWPWQLAESTGARVINGGVPAYGMDQVFLRCETLVESLDPRLVVFAIVADDIQRCEYSYAWAWKPYFDVEGDRLVPKNLPVPDGAPPQPAPSAMRSLLGYSQLADVVLLRTSAEWWLPGRGIIQVHDQGEIVACKILDELERLQQRKKIPVVFVVIQARNTDHNFVDPVVAHARTRSLSVLDLSRDLDAALQADPSFALADHLSPTGNRWVAQKIEAYLAAQGLLGG